MAGVPGPRHTLISKVVAEVGEPGRLMVAGWIVSLMPAKLGYESESSDGSSPPLATYLATVYNVTLQNLPRGFLMVMGMWGSRRNLSLCV